MMGLSKEDDQNKLDKQMFELDVVNQAEKNSTSKERTPNFSLLLMYRIQTFKTLTEHAYSLFLDTYDNKEKVFTRVINFFFFVV